MATSRTSERVPMLCRGLDSWGGAAFVKERLALLGKTIFIISSGFYAAIVVAVLFSAPDHVVPVLLRRDAMLHLAGTLVMGILWLVARRPGCGIATLGALDAGSLIVTGGIWGFMALGAPPGQVMATIMAVTVTAILRSVVVPSSPIRTVVISALALAPAVYVAAFHAAPVPRLDGLGGKVLAVELDLSVTATMWLVTGVAIATVTSRVIYGLRRQIAEAADIGQYTLEAKIGGGGMGEVWRARHRMLIRPAAVKLIRRNALGSMPGDPELLMRRFEREARATAALKSPHTVQLYDFGVTEDNTLYYVMELLEGFDLDTLVRRHGPLPAERAIHILRQACASLADAHANGLVHRDIKPANIVISRVATAYDFVKVLDFGLVKLGNKRDGSDGPDAPGITAVGSTSGTPAFMAPEIALGEAATDHRVDIYSLGCVAYWLLTGKLVFEGDTAMKVIIDHARTAPVPPSRRVELAIPPALDALILECLDKDPGRRPATAEILSARLDACRDLPVWTPERAERWWEAHMPEAGDSRPVADVLLSHEARPVTPKLRPQGVARRPA